MPTVQVVGEFCRTSFSWTPTNVPTLCKMQPHSHCVLRGLDSAVLGVRELQFIGRLGQIASNDPRQTPRRCCSADRTS